MVKKKIVLLNPPGNKLYIRDYYCSKVSKGYYYPTPVDLLIQSGILSAEFDIIVIDAIIEKLTEKQCLQLLLKNDIYGVFALMGAASFEDDKRFLQKLFDEYKTKKKRFLPILLSGDNLLEEPYSYLKRFDWASGILVDFSETSTPKFFDRRFQEVNNICYRKFSDKGFSKDDKINYQKRPSKDSSLDIGLPRQDLFIDKDYRYPYMTSRPLATVLTEYGCPFRCTFCIMSTLGIKYRPTEDIIEELKLLKRLKVRYIYFSDQTFGSNPKRNKELLEAMIKNNFNFKWCCFSRVNVMTPDILKLMKKAGCHTIMFGVESANEELLKIYKKDYTLAQVKESFKVAKDLGIQRMGTFLIGLPEEDESSIRSTLRLMKELDCDFISLNVAVPRKNTELRQKALDNNLINKDFEIMDQSGQTIAMATNSVSKDKLEKYKRKALIGFYLRPTYLIKRLLSIQTYTELKIHIFEGFSMFRNLFIK